MTKRKIHPVTLTLLIILGVVLIGGFGYALISGLHQSEQHKKQQAIIDEENRAFKNELFDNTFKSTQYYSYKGYDNRELVSDNDLIELTISEFGYVRIFVNTELEFKGFLTVDRIRSNDKLFIEYTRIGPPVAHPNFKPISIYKSQIDDFWYLQYGISQEFRLKIVKPYS